MPTLTELAGALLQLIEGCRLKAYQDSGGIWTIGIGHTKGVTAGMQITPEQAAVFFAEDQGPLLAAVKDKPLLEAAALVSFGFNCGSGALHAYLAGHLQLEDKIYDRHGEPHPGLIARRRFERILIEVSKEAVAGA